MTLRYDLKRFFQALQWSSFNRFRRLARSSALAGTAAGQLHDGFRSSFEMLDLLPDEVVKVIWDVGAASGTFTVLAGSMFPMAAIHAFEPQPDQAENVRRLKMNTLSVHEVALGESEGEFDMHITSNRDSTSLLEPAPALTEIYSVKESRKQSCQVTTAKKVLESSTPAPDLLKLDVQGFELSVLLGFGSRIREVKYIIIEMAIVEMYVGQPSFTDVLQFLDSNGFKLVSFGSNTSVGRRLIEFDALFENPSVL